MYIVAIAWLYVVIIMAATESNLTAVAMTLLWYGIVPLALFLWLVGTPQRRRNRQSRMAGKQQADQGNRTDAERNQ
jgi:membrane protein implicated in regulation of membrane protease activity